MVQAINLMFEHVKKRERVQVWLYENTALKIEGEIVGFDEYLNMVLEDAYEVYVKSGERKRIGKILLKGDTVTLVQKAPSADA